MLDIVDGQRGHDDEELLQVTLLGVVKLFAKHPDQKLKVVASQVALQIVDTLIQDFSSFQKGLVTNAIFNLNFFIS